MASKNKTLNTVQWYDLLLKACKEGDEALLEQVLKNLDDCTLGEELPLFLAMCQPNFSIVKKMLKITPQYAAQAFLMRIKPNPARPSLTKRERGKIFKSILPHFAIPMDLDPSSKNSNWWSYAVFLMTPEELEQIPFSTENQKDVYDELTYAALRWCWSHPFPNTPEHITKKVQWVMRHNFLSENYSGKALDNFVCFGHTQSAFVIAKNLPNMKSLSFTTVDALLRSKDLDELHQLSSLLANHNLDNSECKHILQNWNNGEYRVDALEYGQPSLDMVDVMYPFVQPLARAGKTHVLFSQLKYCSYHMAAKLRADYPTLWDWDDFYIQLSKNVPLAPSLQDEHKMIAPSRWLDYVVANVEAFKGKLSWLFDLKKSDYQSPKMVLAILASGNKALVNKCLFEGGQIDGYEMWLKLAQWAGEDFFTEIWKKNGAPVVLTEKDMTSNNVMEIMEEIFKSPLSHIFMSEDKITQWVDIASHENLTAAAKVAARQKSPYLLNAVLQKIVLDSDDAMDVLNAAIKDMPTLKIAVQYLDPHTDCSHVLHEAAESNCLDAVNFLIPLCNPKAHNSAALQIAAANGHIEIVKALIPVSCPKDHGSRALMAAVDHEHIDVALLLWPHSTPKDARNTVDSLDFFDKCQALWEKSQIQKSLPPEDGQRRKKGRKI